MKSTFTNVSIMMVSRLVTRGAQLFSFVLLARYLSSDGFGAYGVLTSAVYLVGLIGNFGIRQSAAQMIGRRQVSDGTVALTMLIIWPIFAAISSVSVWLINRTQFDILSGYQVFVLIVAISSLLLISFMQGIFLGRGETSRFALAETVPRVLLSFIISILWLFDKINLHNCLLAFAASFVVVIPHLAKTIFSGAQDFRLDLSLIPRMVGSGFVFALSLFLIMLQGRIGLFYLQSEIGDEAAGQFFAAQRTSEIFLDLATAAGLVLFSEATRNENALDAIVGAAKTAIGLFGFFSIIGIGIAIASPYMVDIVLGTAYHGAIGMLVILSFGLGPVAAARIMNSVVSGTGRPWLSASIAAVGVPINLLICVITVSYIGPAGAAIGLVAGQSVSCLGYMLACRYIFGIRMSHITKFSA